MNYRLPNPTSEMYRDNHENTFGRRYCRLCKRFRTKHECFTCGRETIEVELHEWRKLKELQDADRRRDETTDAPPTDQQLPDEPGS